MPDKMIPCSNKDTGRLTDLEKLWLTRQRLGVNQHDFGGANGVSRWTYAKMERGALPFNALVAGAVSAWAGGLTLKERVVIARRRYGLPVKCLVRLVGVSRVTLLAWEQHHPERLLSFWRNKLFTFGE